VKKPIFTLIIFVLLLGSLASFVHAETFTVPPLSERTVKLDLNQGDSVKGTISVTGGTGTGVNFMVSDPDGKEVLSYNYTTYATFSFSASITGTYTLSFDNSFCSCAGGKNVTLNYSVNQEPVQVRLPSGANTPFQVNSQSGFNGALPLVIVLVLVIVIVAIASFVIFMRRSRAKNSNAVVTSQATRTLIPLIFLWAYRRVQNEG